MRTFTVRVRPHSLTWRSELPVGLKKQNNTKQNETVKKKKMEKERKATTTIGFPSRYCNIFEL